MLYKPDVFSSGLLAFLLHTKKILGYHSNMTSEKKSVVTFFTLLGYFYPPLVVRSDDQDRMYPLSKVYGKLLVESIALTDSPAGLAAYILEKFSTWTRMEHRSLRAGGHTFRFTKDQLIDNLMMYWTSNSVTTSNPNQSPNKLSFTPPWMLKTKYLNLIHSTILDDGSHFLAFELPEIFANDVLKSIQSFRDWHKNNNKNPEVYIGFEVE